MFSEKLKDYRNILALTQEEFSAKTGISRAIVSMIEAGKRPPSKKVLITLSEFSGKSIDWWYDKEDLDTIYGDSNALDLLLDYMIENGQIKQNEKISVKDRKYIDKMVDQIIKDKLNKKASE